MKQVNRKENLLDSLSGIKLEIGYNVKNAVKHKKIIESKKKKDTGFNFINFKLVDLVTGYKKNKWEELNHKLNFNFLEDLVIDLQIFYMDITTVIDVKLTTEEKNSDIIEKGTQCMKELNEQIIILENEIEEIKKDI